jgi:Uma2 family endonuclease
MRLEQRAGAGMIEPIRPKRGENMATVVKKARRSRPKKAGRAHRNGLVYRIFNNSGGCQVPSWVVDHESYRRWAKSDDFPDRGWFSYLDGIFWADLSMEQLKHNKVKGQITAVLTLLVQTLASGCFLADRMLITNIRAGLSTEPDAGFVSYESLRRKRARLRKGDESVEIVGTLDMVLEVVSPTSEEKDTKILPKLYWRAGVTEYWLVDPRGENLTFEILQCGPKGYLRAPKRNGWVESGVFGNSFRLTQKPDKHGLAEYRLEVR